MPTEILDRKIVKRRPQPGSFWFLLLLLVANVDAARAQSGIASQFVKDNGIGSHPSVVFYENFETRTMTDLLNNVFSNTGNNPSAAILSSDISMASPGRNSGQIRSGGNYGSGSFFFKRLNQGYNKLYLRYYTKVDSVFAQFNGVVWHTSGMLGGYDKVTKGGYPGPYGGAGTKPQGNDWFTMEEGHDLNSYSYWMEMNPDPGGAYWGNVFTRSLKRSYPLGEWVCVEIMIQVNEPVTARNGEYALWVNGEQIAHFRPGAPRGRWNFGEYLFDPAGELFPGIRWRSADSLKVDFFWLNHYVLEPPYGSVWYDDIVVATEYIGPIRTQSLAQRLLKPATPVSLVKAAN